MNRNIGYKLDSFNPFSTYSCMYLSSVPVLPCVSLYSLAEHAYFPQALLFVCSLCFVLVSLNIFVFISAPGQMSL